MPGVSTGRDSLGTEEVGTPLLGGEGAGTGVTGAGTGVTGAGTGVTGVKRDMISIASWAVTPCRSVGDRSRMSISAFIASISSSVSISR